MKIEPPCSPLAAHKHSAKEQLKANQPLEAKRSPSLPAKKAATWNGHRVDTLVTTIPMAVAIVSVMAYEYYDATRSVNIGPLPADVANNTAYSALIAKTVEVCSPSFGWKRICEGFLADAVLKNSPKGQTDLGELFLYTGLKNDALAFEWMKKAAAQDSKDAYYPKYAYFSLPSLFKTSKGLAVLEWLEKQAEAGSPTARQVLFKSVYPVNECEKLISPEKARQYVESQADTGDADALYQSALNHLAALEAQVQKAKQYVESQADAGDVDALYQSALNHLDAFEAQAQKLLSKKEAAK